MKSPWKVSSNMIGDTRMYIVYRLRDIDAVDHSGNREHHGEYTPHRPTAEQLAEDLNRIEEYAKC